LAELQAIEGFSAPLFAAVIGHKEELSAPMGFFCEQATQQEMELFIAGSARAADEGVEYRLSGVLPEAAVGFLWSQVGAHRDEVRAIQFTTDGDAMVPEDLGTLPHLKEIYIDAAGTKTLPSAIFQQPSLRSMELRRLQVRELPDMSPLQALEELVLRRLPRLTSLPPSIGAAKSLQRLLIHDTPITEVPGYLGQCGSLKELQVADCPLMSIHPEVGASTTLRTIKIFADGPLYVEVPEKVFAMRIDKQTRKELKALNVKIPPGSYLPVYNQLKMIIDSFAGLEDVMSGIRAWNRTKDPKAGHMAELILAASRCFIDHEHGPSSNRWYAEQISKYGTGVLKEANEAVMDFKVVKADSPRSQLGKLFGPLKEVDGFDVSTFASFVAQMSKNEAATDC
jgi:hypothetical protein